MKIASISVVLSEENISFFFLDESRNLTSLAACSFHSLFQYVFISFHCFQRTIVKKVSKSIEKTEFSVYYSVGRPITKGFLLFR